MAHGTSLPNIETRLVRHAHLPGGFVGQSPPVWLRRVVVAFLVLGVLLGGTLYFVTRPKRLAVVAGSLLSEMLGAPVLCDWADFNFDGLIHLHNVRD